MSCCGKQRKMFKEQLEKAKIAKNNQPFNTPKTTSAAPVAKPKLSRLERIKIRNERIKRRNERIKRRQDRQTLPSNPNDIKNQNP